MTTTKEAFEAGVDAVIADNTLNKNGFRNATQTVLTAQFPNAEAGAWCDALIAEYNRTGQINGTNYSSFRSKIISDGKDLALIRFDALSTSINSLPETVPAIESARLIDLRDDRDNVDDAIDRCDVLIAAEPAAAGVGKLVKEILRDGKTSLRQHKQGLRDAIQNLTGDPDS